MEKATNRQFEHLHMNYLNVLHAIGIGQLGVNMLDLEQISDYCYKPFPDLND